MKKINKELRNIYRSEEKVPEPSAPNRSFEMIEREMRRRLIFNVSVGVLLFATVVTLVHLFVKNFVIPPEPKAVELPPATYLYTYGLPEQEQWALDYRQVVSQAEYNEAPGPKEFSSKWLKNTAYHLIMGGQALRGDDLAAARYHLEKAHRAFPEMTGVQRDLGTIYLKQHAFGKAKELLQQVQDKNPSAELLNNLGVAHLGLEEYDLAEAVLEKAVQLRPDAAGCYKNLSILYQKTDRTNEAVTAFETYFSLHPHDTPFLETYGAYLAEAGKDREAVRFLEQLKGADPLAVQLLIAKAAARDNDAERTVSALKAASQHLTPRQMIAKLHDDAFEKISRDKSMEELTYQLELAAVVSSTNPIPLSLEK